MLRSVFGLFCVLFLLFDSVAVDLFDKVLHLLYFIYLVTFVFSRQICI